VLHELHALWRARGESDEYFGTLVNAWLGRGGEAVGVPAGEAYVDVGTLHGYREAITTLGRRAAESGDGLGFPGIVIPRALTPSRAPVPGVERVVRPAALAADDGVRAD
jgi:hypothetical protein